MTELEVVRSFISFFRWTNPDRLSLVAATDCLSSTLVTHATPTSCRWIHRQVETMAEYVASVPYAARLEQLVQITRWRWRRHDRTNGTLSFPFGVTSAADLMTTRAELYPTTRDRLRRFGLHSLGIHSAYGELTSHNLWSQYDRHFVGKKAEGSRYSITQRIGFRS